VLIEIDLKIKSWGKQNCHFDLNFAILGKVAISMLMLEIDFIMK